MIFVSDFFSHQVNGGAELTADAILNESLLPIVQINSQHLTPTLLDRYKNERWIFGNYTGIADNILLEVIKKIKDYSVIEFDYKYCKYRSSHKHIATEGACGCENTSHGKLVSIFYAKAKNLFWMSEGQKQEYVRLFPHLKNANNVVLSSNFSDKALSQIQHLRSSNIQKNNKYIILGSNSWIKGVADCINHAKENNLEYEVVEGLSHEQTLNKLAESKGLIFLPKGYDTCPRMVIEAKLLGCELILNENVQHKDEEWFNSEVDVILNYFSKQKDLFFEKVLDQKYTDSITNSNLKFHVITPIYNGELYVDKNIKSLKKQSYKNFTSTIIDDISEDSTQQRVRKNVEDDERFKLIVNEEKKYALRNIVETIDEIEPEDEDVIILLDGDDWLPNSDVLNYLASVYDREEKDVLLTYGSYTEFPTGRNGIEPSEYPEHIVKNNQFRKDQWRASHLRTFKYKLWKQIDKKDLLDKDGFYYKVAYDQAVMLPMLEMAGERIKYIDNSLCVYNRHNPLNVDKQKQEQQYATMLEIREKDPYERIN